MNKPPVIILGAGASFDSVADDEIIPATRDFKPPLTKDICSANFFTKIYGDPSVRLGRLLADLRNSVGYSTLELRLKDIENSAETNLEQKKQINDFLLFLKDIFTKVSNEFARNSTSNYQTLVSHINDYNRKHATNTCIISFNYDTLLDDILEIEKDAEIKSSYINGKIKLIKLHGSCDWNYILNTIPMEHINRSETPAKILELTPYMLKSKDKGLYRKREARDMLEETTSWGKEMFYLFPAIAIPIAEKEHNPICPQEHIDEMVSNLQKTDRILVIGWKAADTYLLDKIKDYVKDGVSVDIISSSEEGAKLIVKEFKKANNKLNINAIVSGGFSEYMYSGAFRNFFKK